MNAVLQPHVEMLPMNVRDLDEVFAIEESVFPFPWTRGNFSDSLNAGYSAWVCRIGGELVGYAVVMIVMDEAHLLTIGVAKRRQGMGFGARLLRHVMQSARAMGATALFLEVRPSNDQALELYQHFGFVRVGVRKGYYPGIVGREDALVLTRGLTEISA